ncbi:hypothetical protein W97_06807 [Coniosporium apollinis CBS 100218]|uniref:ubiquitinyl hydrolase 1 n=1 Tax=Coniosporium apollinis (strain CBS 100218) TaxID=1168221 RepID=R7Z0W0_CONA1|nr:uncharacterized protein W97_06807 [Coniosporium apollinis CBS 100218]EON67664.1 hypothetical protein W97_06807 [Coniosporium apollinis CBS 100218]
MACRQVHSTTTFPHYLPHFFNAPTLASPAYPQHQLPFRPPEHPPSRTTTQFGFQRPAARMDYLQPEEELAHLQKLSNEYQPEVTGPLVGERQPSSVLRTEYANGDAVYVAKTSALAGTYSHYRTCRGDGNCGWRAIAFSYFETLIRLGSRNKFYEEETRLRSLSSMLNAVGFKEYIYEDFAEEAFDLLCNLAAARSVENADVSLLSFFNDESRSIALIMYFKFLTSAWIQTHPEKFEPFLNQDIRSYCEEIGRPNCEIDHVGVTALVDVLVMPAGFAVEILYLDRTSGTEANMHRFDPLDELGLPLTHPLTLRLLYRP